MKSLIYASPGAHAFVIVVKIGKIFTADLKLFEMLPKLFDSKASKYTMVLFTHGDQLGGQSIDDKIKSSSSVSDLVSMCAGRFCVFENSKRGNRLQVREFLRRIDEMVEANGGEHYTSEMFTMAETLIREAEMQQPDNLAGASQKQKKVAWENILINIKDQWNKISEQFIGWCKAKFQNAETHEMLPLIAGDTA